MSDLGVLLQKFYDARNRRLCLQQEIGDKPTEQQLRALREAEEADADAWADYSRIANGSAPWSHVATSWRGRGL
jgi:hypothetical protein